MTRRVLLWTAGTAVAVTMAAIGVVIYARNPEVGTYQLNGLFIMPLFGLVLFGVHRILPIRAQWIAAWALAPLGPIAYLIWPNEQWWAYGALTVIPLLALAAEREDRRRGERGEAERPTYAGYVDGPWGPPQPRRSPSRSTNPMRHPARELACRRQRWLCLDAAARNEVRRAQ